MNCASCGEANRAGARFCGGCGQTLAPRCPSCGVEVEPGRRFCDSCGSSLVAPQAGAAEARKVVTIVFADLIGSTALHERLDAESARRLMDRYHRSMGAVVEAHGGTVMQLLGDGVLAGFGVPRVAEDDAIRAVRAAVGMQQAFRELAREHAGLAGDIGLRVAVYTGEVVAGDDHTHVMGDPVNVAARLQQEARDGDVLLGASTHRLVSERVTLAPVGSFTLKGRAEPVAAYRVVSLERPVGAPAIAFVGREDELRRIRAVYDTAVATRAARLAVLLGSPGLGKSRLIDEFTRRLGDGATVLLAHCDAAGGATFAPLAEALRGLLRIDDGAGGDALRAAILSALPEGEPERARIADGVAALVAGTPTSPEEIFFVVRRGLAALAAQRPVVLAIDDIQWAEPLLLDLVEHLVQWGSDVPLLVLVAARPELRDTRSSLATPGGLVSDVVTLAGLDAGAATRLAANVIGAEALPAAIAGRVLATSEGNPLFVGELVRMLVHDGALKLEGNRWTAGVELADLEMPPTIHALLAARIERLRPEERTVLERAAVIGRHFSRASLAQLLPREITDLDARLESLRRSELVEPDTGWFLGEPVLRFHHVLIRDAAYRRLLKNTRAELHGRFADWLETRAAGAVEHDETLGWHLEQAHQHLRELGPIDAQGRAVGERAARHLAAAGRRALARDDLTPAASLLERALARLDAADPARADLTLDWCEALLSAGDVGTAVRAIAELGRFIEDSDRLRAWHTCFSGQLAVLTDPQALRASADAVEAAAATLTSVGDAAGEAKAHSVHALVLAQLGKIGACEAALDKALAAARRARDRRRANAVLAGAPVAALWGPSPVTRASGRCLDVVRVLRITQGAPAVEAVALRCQAVLETLRGRAEAARRMIASSRRMVEELGITQRVLEADLFAGLIELLEGDAAAAERCLQVAYDGLRAQGLGIDAAQAAALLGRALLAQGRIAEAEAISVESESLAGDSFKAAIAWRGVRAEVLAARGEHAAAVEFARAAVEIAAATDDLLDHADARQALAVALRAAGRGGEADSEERRAIELWEAKGATLLVERARRGATRSIESPRLPEPSAAPAQTVLRRVRPNAATAAMARVEAGVAARDADAVAAMHSDAVEVVDHIMGFSYGREGFLESLRPLLKPRDLTFLHEPLAVLGGSLALSRRYSSASGVASATFDVGPYEREALVLLEVDERSLARRFELFSPDHLGDAVLRLYERYAELLPDGPERRCAAAMARSLAALLAPADLDRWATALAPAVEFTDHQSVGLLGSVRGAEAVLRGIRAWLELVADNSTRVDDILGLRSDALLVRLTTSGTDRAGGGSYEKPRLVVWLFGADGLLTRVEWFDADRDVEALARFDELTAEPPRSERRVRANAATTALQRISAAFGARDAGAFEGLIADGYEQVDHPTGAVYGREAVLGSMQALLRSSGPSLRSEPLATLGESLALSRRWLSSEATTGGRFDVAASEKEQITVSEVDERGRFRRGETFTADHLGDAVARLYERYAELLPDGPARARAAATARSVAAMLLGAFDPVRYASALAPAVEIVDHRILGMLSASGAEAALQNLHSFLAVADDYAVRVDDVLSLERGALLSRGTTCGTDRAGGGSFERPFVSIQVFGADGLLTRIEVFDAERGTEALARFDELTAEPPRSERRVRPNAATANAARLEGVIAAKDADALPALFADSFAVEDHQTGVAYGRPGAIASWRSTLRVQDLRFRQVPLATLGDSLALLRQSTSGVSGGKLDVGAFEWERIALLEVDAQGRHRRTEVFASERLGDAVVRLYERYAELLPDGPARERAAATARSVAALLGPFDLDRYAAVYAPAIEAVDHRILGTWSASGAEAAQQNNLSQLELAADLAVREDDILGLGSNSLLVRSTVRGTDRAGGGAFEGPFLWLVIFGADGLVSRNEFFDADRDVEALTRFDALTTDPPPERFAPAPSRSAERPERRVRANAATAQGARLDAAIVDRDADALPTLVADESEVVDHTTGTTWDRPGALFTLRSLLRAQDPTSRHEPLAILGDSLALCRWSMSASGFAGGTLDVGAYQRDDIVLIEVDAQGRRRRLEQFNTDHLGDAVARLYERYAELLPDGPARARAAATARSVEVLFGPFDPERYAPTNAPTVEVIDHRTLGTWTARGPEANMQNIRSLFEIADNLVNRVDDILALRSDAFLIHWTHLGTDRAGGGAYENRFFVIYAYGADGLLTRSEMFDSDREAEALARFDELTAEAPAASARIENAATTPFENAAARTAVRVREAMEALDWERFAALFAPGFRSIDRRRTAQLESGRDRYLEALRQMLEEFSSLTLTGELLATRGDRLMLGRAQLRGTGDSVGPSELEYVGLLEVDGDGRAVLEMDFDPDDLDAAYAELDARFAAGEAAPHAGTWEAGQRLSRVLSARDWEQWPSVFNEDFILQDHRLLGWGRRSSDEFLVQTRAMAELAPDFGLRGDHCLAINRRGMLSVGGWVGSREGGTFEIPMVSVMVPGPDGRLSRLHTYDLDQLDAARACFAALTAEPPARLIENAATRQADRVSEAWAARDWKRLTQLFPAGGRYIDRKRMTQIGELDRGQQREWMRPIFEMRSSRLVQVMLATRGDRLALARQHVEVADHDIGPTEIESLAIIEVDEHGERVTTVRFDLDDLDAAYAELDARYHAGEAAPHADVAAGMREFSRAFAKRDWDALAARCAPDIVVHDRRLLGWETLHGPAAYIEALRSLVELAPDTKLRLDHVTICEGGYLVITVWEGTREGGAYEAPSLMVAELDAAGRIRRFDQYDLERLEQAQARFAELRPDPLLIPPNAATRAGERWLECIAAEDWEALRALCAPTFVLDDRRRFMLLTGDRDMAVANNQVIAELGGHASPTVLATSGDRLALTHVHWTLGDEAAVSEVEILNVMEVGAEGRVVAIVVFDPDDRRAASAELLARDPHGDAVKRAMVDHDLDRLRAALPDDFVLNDHRRTGLGQLGKDDYLTSLAALFGQAPDVILEILYTVAVEKHGTLFMTRMFGTLADGGEFESLMLRLASFRDERIVGLELFEPEDLDAARARFEALRSEHS